MFIGAQSPRARTIIFFSATILGIGQAFISAECPILASALGSKGSRHPLHKSHKHP